MYIVMIHSDSTDPWAYGSFKNEKTAEKFMKEYQATWTELAWYTLKAQVIKLEKGRKDEYN